MKYETVLPADFDGVFRFTNWSEEEFVGVWNKKEYHFAANSTSPMIIPEHSPLEIQHIRKKFAKDLAEREFFKKEKYEQLRMQEGKKNSGMVDARLSSFHQAGAYTLNDLADGIQKCLKPLELRKAEVSVVQETPLEEKLSKNDEGGLNTVALDKKASLRSRAMEGKGLPQS